MKLNGRLIVFCLLTLFQTGVVLCVAYFSHIYVKGHLRTLVGNQVVKDNISFTEQLNTNIERMKLYDLRIGADDWLVLQNIVTNTRLPNGGVLSVLDLDTNRLICHPDFEKHPELSDVDMPAWKELEATGKMVEFNGKNVVRTGKVAMDDDVYWMAGRSLGESNVAILAQQKQSEIEKSIAGAAAPITTLTIGVSLGGLLMVTAFGAFVLWHSEKRINEANREVEELTDNTPIQSRAFADMPTASTA